LLLLLFFLLPGELDSTKLTLEATDEASNKRQITIDIVVLDQTAPEIRPSINPLTAEAAVPFDLTFPSVEVFDAIDNLKDKLTSNATADLTNELGTFIVELTLTEADSAGNVAEPAYLTVVVLDTKGPVRKENVGNTELECFVKMNTWRC
jgi:hypothetical protein